MIEVLSIIIGIGILGFAEWKHYKTGNGERFEQVHKLLDADKKP